MFPEGRLLEFLIVGAVALIVVGPKDLPVLMRKVGQFIGRMRAMAAEFRASFDELARQSELDELRKEVEALRNAQPSQVASHVLGGDMTTTFDDINASLEGSGVTFNPALASYSHEAAMDAARAPVGEAPVQAPRKPRKPRAKAPDTPIVTPAEPKVRKPRARKTEIIT